MHRREKYRVRKIEREITRVTLRATILRMWEIDKGSKLLARRLAKERAAVDIQSISIMKLFVKASAARYT